jgi:hypothetical protein
MRKSTGFILCLSFLMGISLHLHAQPEKTLDQAELLKQFLGTWKAEISPDTFIISEITPCGKGFHQSIQVLAKEEAFYSGEGITGFTSDKRGIISVDLTEDGIINIQKGRFVSENKLLLEDFGAGQDHASALIEIEFGAESLIQRNKWRGKSLSWDVDWMDPMTFKKIK